MNYTVIVSDVADAEVRAAGQWLSEDVSPAFAGRWLEGLARAIEGLTLFPRSHALARENDVYDVEVRRMLYYGPTKRRGGSVYRVLFHIIEAAEGEATGTVRVLDVYHGAQQTQNADNSKEDEE